MSLITCCPACGTMFRVVPDQLRISDGWVRCGHCAEVFDATAHMANEVPAHPLDNPETQPMEALLEQEAAPATFAPVVEAPAVAQKQAPPAQPTAAPETAVPPSGLPDSELNESPLDQPFVFRRSDLGAGDDIPSVSPPVVPSSRLREDEEPDLHDMSFVRQARRRQLWRRPWVRAMLVLGLLALTALLAMQLTLHDRDRLAASEPALRPWLQRMCLVLQCRIEPPRAIEALAIETSSFNKLRNDAYRLHFTLKNNAGTEVAVPAMELTLTDGQDQPLLRRVLTPSDLGAAAPVLAPGAEWSASIPLAVDGNGRIAGYRLLAFYP